MKRLRGILYTFVLLFTILICTAKADANLIAQGNNMIFDDDLNLVWLIDPAYKNLKMTWSDAVAWADNLVYAGADDWRLPGVVAADPQIAYNQTSSEMGHLYYTELGNLADPNKTAPLIGGLLSGYLKDYWYWTKDAYDLTSSWTFDFSRGYQSHPGTGDSNEFNVLAVRSVPIPSALVLLGSGLVGAIGLGWRKRRAFGG